MTSFEERVTVLFADLASSTELKLRRMLDRLSRVASEGETP